MGLVLGWKVETGELSQCELDLNLSIKLFAITADFSVLPRVRLLKTT